MDRLKAALVQMRHGESLDANLANARVWLERASDAGTDVALLPEYWSAVFPSTPDAMAGDATRVRAFLADASRELGLVVGANILERLGGTLWNVGVAYEDGRPALEQPKVHPMAREVASGVSAGDGFQVGYVRGRATGMLVCADVLYPEAARILSLQGAQMLLNPVMSPWREADDTREAREALFVARAYDSAAFVLKAGGFRRGPDLPVVAGRSLAAAPWGVLAKARSEFEEELLLVDLDFARLARHREHQALFPPRRPQAYGGLG